jgi:hypothetical protein
MARSQKTKVIEWIFQQRYDAETGIISHALVTFEDIKAGIDATGAKLDKDNPPNFWKDITRSNPENHWPKSVLAAGYTGADAIGEGGKASFLFVKVPPGQTTAFRAGLEPPVELVERPHIVQSLSMPLAMKALGRKDENWLAQVANRLFVVETHFAVFSPRDVAEVSFLQTGVKMRRGEVDAAYSLSDVEGKTWLVSCEAKGRREKIHEPQLLRAAKQLAATEAAESAEGVIPFGIKIIEKSLLHTVEFEPIEESHEDLVIASEGVIRLAPAVRGVE